METDKSQKAVSHTPNYTVDEIMTRVSKGVRGELSDSEKEDLHLAVVTDFAKLLEVDDPRCHAYGMVMKETGRLFPIGDIRNPDSYSHTGN